MTGTKSLLLVIVATSALLTSAAATSSSAPSCANLNAYARSFPAVVLLPKPAAYVPGLKCGAVWLKGSCCDLVGLERLATVKNNAINSSLQKLRANLDCLERKLDDFKKQSRDNMAMMELPAVKFLQRLSVNEFQTNFARQAGVCWNHMKQVRGAALCGACAADSAAKFRQGKAAVSHAACDAMLAQCGAYFAELLALVGGLARFERILAAAPSSLITEKVKDLILSLDSISKEVSSNTVIDDISIMQTATDPKVKNEKRNSVCNSLFVLNDKTFIEKLEPLMDLVCRKGDNIIEGFKTYSNSLKQARSLNEGSLGQSAGDISQFNSNWVGESKLLRADISLVEHSTDTMNLTMVFL